MSDALSKINSPLEITLEWTRTLPEPAAILSLAAFEMKKRSDKVEHFGQIVFLGSAIDLNGKASSDDGSIHLDVLDTTDNMAPFGTCRMTIDLEKSSVDRIKLGVCSIPEKKGKKLSFCDCVSACVTLKDASGQSFTQNLPLIAPKAGVMAISLGTFKGGRSWSYKAEPLPLSGGVEKLLDTYADKRVYSTHPYTQESIHKDLQKRITVYFEESLERARKEEEANKAKREAEEARRMAEARRRFEEEKARLAAEEEARRREEEERIRKEEEEARRKAEEEEARRKAEEEAKKKAAEEAKRKAEEEEARRKAEEEAKKKAAEEAKRKAEEEARRKAEEEAKKKAAEEATSTPGPSTAPRSGSKRWKRQVEMMLDAGEPNASVPVGSPKELTEVQVSRKTKAWKNARSIRPVEEENEPNSADAETTISASSAIIEPVSSGVKNGGKKWKSQVAKMHENDSEDVSVESEVSVPVPTPQGQIPTPSSLNNKRKYPKIKR